MASQDRDKRNCSTSANLSIQDDELQGSESAQNRNNINRRKRHNERQKARLRAENEALSVRITNQII